MGFCPTCKEEYDGAAQVCVDCGVDLVSALSEGPKEETFDESLLFSGSEELARKVESVLLEQQIPAFRYEESREHQGLTGFAVAVPPEFYGPARYVVGSGIADISLRPMGDALWVASPGEFGDEPEDEEEPGFSEPIKACLDRGSEGVEGLVDVLISGDEDLAAEATVAIQSAGDPVVPCLSQRLEKAFGARDLRSLSLLLAALRMMGVVPPLLQGILTNDDPELRAFGFRMLTDLSIEGSRDHLLSGLSDADSRVREEAVELLYHLHGNDLGFDSAAPPEKNTRLLAKVKNWLESSSA